MWQHSLVVLLAFSTAFPTQVVEAAMTREKLKKIADDILAKIEQYGPIIIKIIAPFLAKKLVEIGVIKIVGMIGAQVGKREVVEGETEIQAAEKYLTLQFYTMIGTLKREFHERIDMEAINDEIENWQEIVSELAKAAKEKIFEFIHQFGSFNFESYIRSIIDRFFTKQTVEKRSVIRVDVDKDTLNKYEQVLEELRDLLKNKFGEIV